MAARTHAHTLVRTRTRSHARTSKLGLVLKALSTTHLEAVGVLCQRSHSLLDCRALLISGLEAEGCLHQPAGIGSMGGPGVLELAACTATVRGEVANPYPIEGVVDVGGRPRPQDGRPLGTTSHLGAGKCLQAASRRPPGRPHCRSAPAPRPFLLPSLLVASQPQDNPYPNPFPHHTSLLLTNP